MYEFDLSAFLRAVRAKRRRIIINCSIAAALALIVGFSIPKQYVSSVSLAAESQDEEAMGGMSALASMAGISLGGGTDAIGPNLYPDVVATNDFLVNLLDVRVQTADGKVNTTFFDYMKDYSKFPWWTSARLAVTRGIKRVLSNGEKKSLNSAAEIDPQRLSEEEDALVKVLQGLVNCTVDDKTGVINISVRSQDPLVAKLMVDTVTTHLQYFITQYRTTKVRNDLEYYHRLEAEAKQKYTNAQKRYADYCDSHQDAILQSAIMEQESLENELQMAFNNYSQIKQQAQVAEAKVQERTPAFTVIEKAAVPIRHESPKKLFILLAYVFVAFMGTLGWIYIRLLFSKKKGRAIASEVQMEIPE